jgi:hypothetical protein
MHSSASTWFSVWMCDLTAWRSAAVTFVPSTFWHRLWVAHRSRTAALLPSSDQIWVTSGMLETKIDAVGRPVFRRSRAARTPLLNTSGDVVEAPVGTQTSLRPVRIVTYCAPTATAASAWLRSADAFVPPTARFEVRPEIAGFAASSRS